MPVLLISFLNGINFNKHCTNNKQCSVSEITEQNDYCTDDGCICNCCTKTPQESKMADVFLPTKSNKIILKFVYWKSNEQNLQQLNLNKSYFCKQNKHAEYSERKLAARIQCFLL
jgi:hypothetical protein